ncbi:protein LIFEGUARD 4-like [Bidens hawaiensis]|uniref:protein LIFEGUARD 4-like n=1 Tax=Bidens hawaiensis TaxID=980011 RepID=UPI00404A5305
MGKHNDNDIEAAKQYPSQMEDPQLRWGFIRKVYSIMTLQLLLTVVIASIVVATPRINQFFHTQAGLIAYIIILVFAIIIAILMGMFLHRHPLNMIMLGLFTFAFSLIVGVACVFSKGKIILEASILTLVVSVSLTLFTFWAAKRGCDFNFLWPFLFCSLILILLFSIIQIFFPMGSLVRMLISFFVALVYCGFIIYDTDNLIKRCSYDEYVLAAAMLYIDMIQLFLAILQILGFIDD